MAAAGRGDDERSPMRSRRPISWCDDACEKWYGAERKKPPHFAEAIVAFRRGEDGAVKEMLRLMMQAE